ncbi:MAG TPA: amidohydrolase [Chloroflexota bacterium]|nr:amidohydrolase [Chloroflexota bacterium]
MTTPAAPAPAADTTRTPLIDPSLDATVREWFTWLHQHPELSFHEKQTSSYVAERLRELGLKPRERVGTAPNGEPLYSVVAVVAPERPGPALALRADMDALPISEVTGLSYASRHTGAMHACGHDAHTAMLLGAAAALQEEHRRAPLPGPVLLIFQPAEEQPPGGALGLIEAGVLDDPPVGAIFGLHVGNKDVGTFSLSNGPRNAASDGVRIVVRGRGGHAAAPHKSVDPVVVAAHVVIGLQTIVSRQISPRQPVVLTIGVISGGTKANVIPESVTLQGSVRTLDPDVREMMPVKIKALAEGICAAYGGTAEVDYTRGYDVLVNDPAMSDLARAAAVEVAGEAALQPAESGMGGEDFGRYLQKVPGAFVTIGSGDPQVAPEERPPGHNPRSMVDQRALAYGVAWYLALTRRYFASRAE